MDGLINNIDVITQCWGKKKKRIRKCKEETVTAL